MNSLKMLFAVVVAVIAFSEHSSALFPQYSQFYPIDTCGGPHIYTLDTVADFQKFSSQNVLRITQRGLWTYTYIRAGETITRTVLDQGSKSCLIFIPGDKLVSAKRVFNSDLEFSEIGLFSGAFFNGTGVITNQPEYSLSQPMDVESYAFTGTQSWTVFPNIDFTGISTCLKLDQNDPLERGYQITGDSFPQMKIGSVRLGCVGETKSIISRDAENSRQTSIDDIVISKYVIDLDEKEARHTFIQ